MRAAGFDLTITPRIMFRDVAVGRGRSVPVPDALPRLALDQAFATVQLPIHLNGSDRGRRFDLHDRRQRARVYEIVLREGAAQDVLAYIDGTLLVDLWDELVLPREVRIAWDGVIAGPRPDRVASRTNRVWPRSRSRSPESSSAWTNRTATSSPAGPRCWPGT